MGLIDDFVQGVSREINKVQVRSQEMMQTYQLQSQIRTLEGKKTATLIEIGRLIYEKYQRAVDVCEEILIEKSKEVTAIDLEVAAAQTDLDKLKAQYDPSRPASQRAEAKAGYTTTPGFTCRHCHAPAAAEKAFCPSCGGSLKESPDAAGNENGG